MADNSKSYEDVKKKLLESRGGDRLQCWLELEMLKRQDPEFKEWMSPCVPYLKLHSWSTDDPKHPKCVFSYTVIPENQNSMGNMHGGCTATLFDYCTSMPVSLIHTPDFWWFMGVSRTLNVTYLKPIPVGEEIYIESEMLSIGKNMATVRGVMRRKSDNAVLAICEHGKFNVDPPTPKSKM